MPADLAPLRPRDVRGARGGERLGGPAGRTAVLAAGLVLLFAAAAGSVGVGAGSLTTAQVWQALGTDDGSSAATIVWDMRVPRTLTALVAGLALGIAGALMQTLTRNPLADPGLFGVNAGAGLAVVVAVGALGFTSFDRYVWAALAGAFAVSVAVYAIGFATGSDSPMTLVLAGVAITALLTGIATGLALVDPGRFNAMRGWMAGSVAGRDLGTVATASGIIALGLIVSAVVARPLGQLGLGDDLARSLGVHVGITRLGTAAAIMLLAGTATAAAGPIVFVGLMVPHLARALVGPSTGWLLAYSGVAGAVLLICADIAGRVVIGPGEAPAGLITAILGAPVLALVARRKQISG